MNSMVVDTIHQRRSVRFYKPDTVPREALRTIIDAGNAAPSGSGAQGWRFVVVEDAAMRARLSELALPRYRAWMQKAPNALKELRAEIDAVVSDPVYYDAPAVVFVIGRGMTADLDCPMVCENMMLAATSLGLGSCWVYFGQLVLDDPGVREALRMQQGEKVYGPILLGYPRDELPPRKPKKPAEVVWV
jgi:nitroreductase